MMNFIFNIGVLLFLTITVSYIQGGPIKSESDSSNVSSIGNTKDQCSTNEEYTQCGSICPASCSDLFYPQEIKFCAFICVRGCFCKQGFYRSEDGKCVKPEKCCRGQNEYYTQCGTACPAVCNRQPQLCIQDCVKGCFCKSDFVREDNSTNSPCIKPDQCYKENL